VRLGESEANLDNSVNARLPDHKIALSEQGRAQAAAVGEFLAKTLDGSMRTRILCSPYLRARETSAAIEQALAAAAVKFLPKLFPREYEHYEKHKRFEGEFFAPMPLGESRCNVADRVKGVFGTILRDASSDRSDPITDFIIVSHGVTIRCFRMQWMHYS
jgi:broad specificity phosphatase PhoE